MDGECAFCGRADAATHQVFCQDCYAQHRVCAPCADSAVREGAVIDAAPHLEAA
jgi:hypothetical protein